MEQHLMREERNLLECLRENYNCEYVYYDGEINEWIVLTQNGDGLFVRASFDECTFSLNRGYVHNIGELLK